ncbi:hypothetical protein PGIGA_G00029570 [Pangasianodon gigas]|uniref:Uncharacterized protein n=1 Tax=Pangasianodon gigas TaxID=30993 RepID=A0ACC5WXT3_PANGG|nr:hypothetical protein [Pangasianodon gigas]
MFIHEDVLSAETCSVSLQACRRRCFPGNASGLSGLWLEGRASFSKLRVTAFRCLDAEENILLDEKEMENLDFSEEEIQEQLAVLGYTNITKQRLRDFKRDLDLLIHHEKSKSSTSAEWSSPESHSSSCKSPPAFTKEKVPVPSAASKYSYIYSGNRAADQHRQVLTSTFNDENCDTVNLGHGDSYIKHSVAPRCIRPSTAPNRLELEDASSDIYHSVLSASEPERPQRDLHTKPALKRKVLRKHRGHSQVCDESTYSEDSGKFSSI